MKIADEIKKCNFNINEKKKVNNYLIYYFFYNLDFGYFRARFLKK